MIPLSVPYLIIITLSQDSPTSLRHPSEVSLLPPESIPHRRDAFAQSGICLSGQNSAQLINRRLNNPISRISRVLRPIFWFVSHGPDKSANSEDGLLLPARLITIKEGRNAWRSSRYGKITPSYGEVN